MTIKQLEINMQSIQDYIDYAWKLYQDPKTRFYPIIDDRFEMERIHKTAFMENLLHVIEIDGELATLPILVDHDSDHIQAAGGIASATQFDVAADYFYDLLSIKYSGYTYIAGYPSSNTAACAYHDGKRHEIIENLTRMERSLEDFNDVIPDGYEPLSLGKYSLFNQIHTESLGEVYWSASDIINNLDRWCVVVNEGEIVSSTAGAIHYEKEGRTYAEVYFILSDDNAKELLIALIDLLIYHDVDEILYMVDFDDIEMLKYLDELGFKKTDDYLCYKIAL